jgi:hypothetical protein
MHLISPHHAELLVHVAKIRELLIIDVQNNDTVVGGVAAEPFNLRRKNILDILPMVR